MPKIKYNEYSYHECPDDYDPLDYDDDCDYSDSCYPLELAACYGDLEAVQAYFQSMPLLVGSHEASQALISAVGYGHLPVIHYLISQGADPRYQDGDFHLNTAFLTALYRDQLQIVQYLVHHHPINLSDELTRFNSFINENGYLDLLNNSSVLWSIDYLRSQQEHTELQLTLNTSEQYQRKRL